MMKDDVLKELDAVMDEKTIAFFSVELKQREDGSFLPTITEFAPENVPYELRVHLSDAIIDLAQRIRQHR
jgi:hypothetical protein